MASNSHLYFTEDLRILPRPLVSEENQKYQTHTKPVHSESSRPPTMTYMAASSSSGSCRPYGAAAAAAVEVPAAVRRLHTILIIVDTISKSKTRNAQKIGIRRPSES